jgi:tetratricopeptide (TPR) repeat protein
MTCQEIETAELAEKYVLGQLDSEDQEAYESHYFLCSRCFEELQLRQGMQAELRTIKAARPVPLRRQRQYAWIAWGAVAAAVALTVALGWWRLVHPPAPPGIPAVSRKAPLPAKTGPSLELLARVEPPPYTAPTLRGAATLDPRFRDAMEKYRQGQFAAAIPGLLAASRSDPKSPDPQFFLGICYLMDGRPQEAISHLQATIDLGSTLDLEMAHFYLAKALLRDKAIARTETELERAIALHGDLEAQSRDLLKQLKSLPDSQ